MSYPKIISAKHMSIIVVALSLAFVTHVTSLAMMPASCSPDSVEVPLRYRNLCLIYNELLRQHVAHNAANAANRYVTQDAGPADNSDFIIIPDGGVKRQDLDHVFLRFGRSRR